MRSLFGRSSAGARERRRSEGRLNEIPMGSGTELTSKRGLLVLKVWSEISWFHKVEEDEASGIGLKERL